MTLDRLRALREAATPDMPNRWRSMNEEPPRVAVLAPAGVWVTLPYDEADAALIALAPSLVDALIEAHEALRFYADKTHWTQMASWGGRIHDDESEVIVDYGSIARAAVARIDTLDKGNA